MALLGVFIPIILQFKIHHIAKSEVEKIKAELETIKSDSKTAVNQEIKKVEYTKENITAFVNQYCNADFDEIVVLDNLAGYIVFADTNKCNTSEGYNFGDVFNYDEDLTRRRRAKVEEMKKEFCILFNQKYDNTSYYIENGKLVARIGVSDKVLKESGWTGERKFVVEV